VGHVISALPNFLEEHKEVLLIHPIRIVLIIVLALIARALLHRAINRLVRTSAKGEVPAILRPLADRGPVNGLLESTGLLSERRRQRAETVGSILRSTTSVVIGVFALLLILDELNVKLAPFIAGAGIVGVALGFGAQNLVKDFLSGIFIMLEDQYGVGDVIDLGEASGTVEGVGLRTTRLRDLNGTVWYMRNGEILRVGNRSQGFARVVLDVPLPYAASIDAAGQAMVAAADELGQEPDWGHAILEEPELLGVERIGEDGVVLRMTVKTSPADQARIGRELRRRVKERLDGQGIPLSFGEGKIDLRSDLAPDAPMPADSAPSEAQPASTQPASTQPARASRASAEVPNRPPQGPTNPHR
jgi:moderate conductance mechanosensitive channel